MAGTHFQGPVESTLGFTQGGVPLPGSGGVQALADNTGGVAGASVEAATTATTAAGVTASGDMDGVDTVNEATLEAALLAQETELGLLKADVEAIATALNTNNDNIASIVAALAAAGIVV